MDASLCQHVLRELLDHQAATDAKLKTTESMLLKLDELRSRTLAHRTTSESQLVKLTGLIDLVSSAIQESPRLFQEFPARGRRTLLFGRASSWRARTLGRPTQHFGFIRCCHRAGGFTSLQARPTPVDRKRRLFSRAHHW